jgi:RNA polymerase sigma-70 factor (ECF subfamily)
MDGIQHESQLVAQAKSGDKEAVSALYAAYAQSIFQYVSFRVDSRMTAEDLTAEVFLRMVRGISTFEDRGLPFGAWLFRIAGNLIIEHFRQDKRVTFTVLSDDERGDDSESFRRVENEEDRQRLMAALSLLPQEYQDVLILRFMQSLSHSEVAAILGKSDVAIRSIQHRALKALADQMGAPSEKPRSYQRGDRP